MCAYKNTQCSMSFGEAENVSVATRSGLSILHLGVPVSACCVKLNDSSDVSFVIAPCTN